MKGILNLRRRLPGRAARTREGLAEGHRPLREGWLPALLRTKQGTGARGQSRHGAATGTYSDGGGCHSRFLNFPFPCSFTPNLLTWSPAMARKYFNIFDAAARFASEGGKDVWFFFLTFHREIQIKFYRFSSSCSITPKRCWHQGGHC